MGKGADKTNPAEDLRAMFEAFGKAMGISDHSVIER
jgi:hypothetical protein